MIWRINFRFWSRRIRSISKTISGLIIFITIPTLRFTFHSQYLQNSGADHVISNHETSDSFVLTLVFALYWRLTFTVINFHHLIVCITRTPRRVVIKYWYPSEFLSISQSSGGSDGAYLMFQFYIYSRYPSEYPHTRRQQYILTSGMQLVFEYMLSINEDILDR